VEEATDVLRNVSLDENLIGQPGYRLRDPRIRAADPEDLDFPSIRHFRCAQRENGPWAHGLLEYARATCQESDGIYLRTTRRPKESVRTSGPGAPYSLLR
jgi:hypothetical protein